MHANGQDGPQQLLGILDLAAGRDKLGIGLIRTALPSITV
jgi:hypothetical protein